MTTTLTDAERAAMQQRAKRTERRLIEAGLDHTITDDILTMLALYEASQAALTGALAELTAARAENAAEHSDNREWSEMSLTMLVIIRKLAAQRLANIDAEINRRDDEMAGQ